MDQEEIIRRFSPRMTPANTGENFLSSQPASIPNHPQKEIDLHGHSPGEVDDVVHHFLLNALQESLVFIRIVTGHGENSDVGFSVVNRETNAQLKRLFEGRVFHFTFTPQKGYFDVFLQYERF